MTAPIATTFEGRERQLSASILSARAAELGVPVRQVCRECRWPKRDDGECVTPVAMARAVTDFVGGLDRVGGSPNMSEQALWILAAMTRAPTDSFATCSRERSRVQRVRLEALMSALTTLAPLWMGATVMRPTPAIPIERAKRTATALAEVLAILWVARGVTRSISGRLKDRDSLRLAFAASDLAPLLEAWGVVRDAHRSLYPAEVLPAIDDVWAAWVAYKEVA